MLDWTHESRWLEPMVPENLLCAKALPYIDLTLIPYYRIKILTGELAPLSGHVTRNGRLRMYVLWVS